MIEIIIPANTSWESIFQYYTGKNITISDLVVFIESGGIRSKQKGGVVPGGAWALDAVGRLVSVGANVAQGAAEGAAVGAAAGPAGAAVGAVAGAVIQTALIEGAAAMISVAAGPAAPIAQRTIAIGLSIGVSLAFAAYSAWLAGQPAEGILEQQGGSDYISQDSMSSQIHEVIPVITALKKSLGNDFDLCMKIVLLNLQKTHPTFPKRVFSLENILTGVAAQVVLKNKEKFTNTKIRSKTRKNRK
jgi:hypothetical protein